MLDKLLKTKTRDAKRVGRGIGSGKGGHTVGRGQKGQKSRSGHRSPRPGFEGGSMPLSRRIPKLKGFKRTEFQDQKAFQIVSLSQLDSFKSGETITLEKLKKEGIIKSKSRNTKVKILANGEITKAVNIDGVIVSKSAKEAIEKAGGKVK